MTITDHTYDLALDAVQAAMPASHATVVAAIQTATRCDNRTARNIVGDLLDVGTVRYVDHGHTLVAAW